VFYIDPQEANMLLWTILREGNGMEPFKVGDKVVRESDPATVEKLVHLIGTDVDSLSAQLRELREELRQKGVVAA
jgi:hypothetical protein